jgi:hypothetical protein
MDVQIVSKYWLYSLQNGGDVYVAMSKDPLAGKSMVLNPSGLQVVIEQSDR